MFEPGKLYEFTNAPSMGDFLTNDGSLKTIEAYLDKEADMIVICRGKLVDVPKKSVVLCCSTVKHLKEASWRCGQLFLFEDKIFVINPEYEAFETAFKEYV